MEQEKSRVESRSRRGSLFVAEEPKPPAFQHEVGHEMRGCSLGKLDGSRRIQHALHDFRRIEYALGTTLGDATQ